MNTIFAILGAFLLWLTAAGGSPISPFGDPGDAPFQAQNLTGPFRGDPNAEQYCLYGGVPKGAGYAEAGWIEVYMKHWSPYFEAPNLVTQDTGESSRKQCGRDFITSLYATSSSAIIRDNCDVTGPGGNHPDPAQEGVKLLFTMGVDIGNEDGREGSIEAAFRQAARENPAHGRGYKDSSIKCEWDPRPPPF